MPSGRDGSSREGMAVGYSQISTEPSSGEEQVANNSGCCSWIIDKAVDYVDSLDWCSQTSRSRKDFLEEFDGANIYMIVAVWTHYWKKPPEAMRRFYLSSFQSSCHIIYYIFFTIVALAGNIYMPMQFLKEMFKKFGATNDLDEETKRQGPWKMLRLALRMIEDTCPQNASTEVRFTVLLMFILLCHQAFNSYKSMPQQYAFLQEAMQLRQQKKRYCGLDTFFMSLGFMANLYCLFYVPVLLYLMLVNPDEPVTVDDVILNGLSIYFVLEVDDMLVTAADQSFMSAAVSEAVANVDDSDVMGRGHQDIISKVLFLLWAAGIVVVLALYGLICWRATACV